MSYSTPLSNNHQQVHKYKFNPNQQSHELHDRIQKLRGGWKGRFRPEEMGYEMETWKALTKSEREQAKRTHQFMLELRAMQEIELEVQLQIARESLESNYQIIGE